MTTKPVVLLWLNETGPYREALAEGGLSDRIELHAVRMDEVPSPELMARCDAMLAWRAGAGVLPRMPRLRWIQAQTGGVEGWLALPDLPAGITLTCARGTHRVQMTENILGALFHLTKPYAAITVDQREQRWTRRISELLAGRTLGILGLGAIGQEVARRAAVLEMRVIGVRRSGASVEGVERVYPAERADEVLKASDFLLLLLPSTTETRGYMKTARLAMMKPTAYLLNFGRGDLVVDQELVDAVKAGVIAGAVLDVFTTEPLPREHPFWVTPGITVLPHIGGLHPERDRIVAALWIENLRRFLDGRPLVQLVDKALGY
jgi:phosphoglycerate dehydrogenase-like enzyme